MDFVERYRLQKRNVLVEFLKEAVVDGKSLDSKAVNLLLAYIDDEEITRLWITAVDTNRNKKRK